MEKLKLTAHIKDIELKNKMYKVIDKANSCLKNYDIKATEFLNPFEVKNAIDILNSESDLKYKVDGGYENAERQLIYIFPYYIEEDDVESDLRVIQIEGNFKFKAISHRDYLGAVLGLGIRRNKIGDLLLKENVCYLTVCEEIEEFLVNNLNSIGKSPCKVTVVEDNFEELVPNFKEEIILVQSLRIDSIVSKLIRASRNRAQTMIEEGMVLLDYNRVKDKSREVKNQERITISGHGKYVLDKIIGNSKSGKFKVLVKKYT